MNTEALSIVMEVVSAALGLPAGQLKDDDALGTIEEWDSLGHLNILMALENKFGAQVAKLTELSKATSVKKIVSVLQTHHVL